MCRVALIWAVGWVLAISPQIHANPSNVIILFADDLGYGDLSCYGHPTIRTPNLDRMAREGTRFTQFYSAATVCTPSRAALLTGRLPIRSAMAGSASSRVIFPRHKTGLPDLEVTLAEALKTRGYATACIGKWHLGHEMPYRPLRHGFDRYYGLLYSNDMKPLELYQDDEAIEDPVEQESLTERYTEQSVKFIKEHAGKKPFFLYLPYTMPHVPLFVTKQFAGRSPAGLYGDVIETIDWSVGEILKSVQESDIAEDTFVFFTSDNGPWLTKGIRGGSAGLLREGKGSTWEGGVRVPGIAWQPGTVKAGVITQELGSTLDLFPTALAMAGAEMPSDRVYDGVNLLPMLKGESACPRDVNFFYRNDVLYAVRKGPWKAHFITKPAYGRRRPMKHDPPLLFHLLHDPSEKHNVAKDHPNVIAELTTTVEEHQATLRPVKPLY